MAWSDPISPIRGELKIFFVNITDNGEGERGGGKNLRIIHFFSLFHL